MTNATKAGWFVARDGAQEGPLSRDELRRRLEAGTIGAKTLVWCQGMTTWRELDATPLKTLVVAAPVAARWKPMGRAALDQLLSEESDAPPGLPAENMAPLSNEGLPEYVSVAPSPQDRGVRNVRAPNRVNGAPRPGDGAGRLPGDAGDNGGRGPGAPDPRGAVGFDPGHAAGHDASGRARVAPAKVWIALLGVTGGLALGLLATLVVLGLNAKDVPPPAPPPVAEAHPPRPAPAAQPPVESGEAAAIPRDEPVPTEHPERPAKPPKEERKPSSVTGVESPPKKRPETAEKKSPPEKASEKVAASANAPASAVDEQFEKLVGKGSARALGSRDEPAAPPAQPEPAPVPTPAPARSLLPEKLTQAQITGVVVQHKGAVRGCIQAQKDKEPELTGTLVMRWTIRPDGSTAGVQVKGGDGGALGACLTGLVKGWKFPGYSGPPMPPIDFPFRF